MTDPIPYSADTTVLVISNHKDLALFRRREELKIHGLLMPFAFSAQRHKGLIAYAGQALHSSPPNSFRDGNGIRILRHQQRPFTAEDPPELIEGMTQLKEIFACAEQNAAGCQALSVNSPHHQKFRTHEPALAYTLQGRRTIAKNEAEEEYEVPEGHLFIFHLSHRAPEPPLPGEDIRVAITMA